MIKPIKIVDTVVTSTTKAVERFASKASTDATDAAQELPHADGNLLQAYRGVKPTKLFASFEEFSKNFMERLETFKEKIPQSLYAKVKAAADAGDFSLSKVVADHYAGLNECKTVAQAKKMYPEIKVFDLDFEGTIAKDLKSVIPTSLCTQVKNCATLEEKVKLVNQFFDSRLGNCLKKWGIYPEVKQIQDSIILEIVTGKFKGSTKPKDIASVFTYKEPLQYKFMREPNREEAILNILRDSYINGNSLANQVFKTVDGREIHLARLHKFDRLAGLDGNFVNFIKKSEETAGEFAKLSTMDKSEISSAVFTQTWRTSGLRRDLGNATSYTKDWSIVKAVWQKTMFPETTFYPTDKLIDTYLLELYKTGRRTVSSKNPFEKFTQTTVMDKPKIMLLKRLYKYSKSIDEDKRILDNPMFKEFKAQFDTEAMKKTLESIEEHYKNAFFKRFWTEDRVARFTTALNSNREIAKNNVEISEKLLTDAMNSAFTE